MKKVNTIKVGIITGFIATTVAKLVYEIECTTPIPKDAWGLVKHFYSSSPLWITILWVIFSLLLSLLFTMYIMGIPTEEKR